MALSHYITDGTTTLQLNDGTAAWTESWGMSNPGAGEAWAVDVHEIELLGGNATVLANQVTLHRLLQQARMWQDPKTRRFGQRVFYCVSLDGSTTYRCELAGGEFVPTPERVKGEWAIGRRRGTLTLMRRNWIEGPESQISLTNPNGTDNTAGLKVYTGDSSGTGTIGNYKINWFDVTAAKIAGDLPAKIKLKYDFLNNLAQGFNYSIFRSATAIPSTSTFNTLHWDTGMGTTYDTGTYVSFTPPNDVGQFGPLAKSENLFFRIFSTLSWSASGTYKITPEIIMKYATWKLQPVLINGDNTARIYDLGLFKAPYFASGVDTLVKIVFAIESKTSVTHYCTTISVTPCNQTRKLFYTGLASIALDVVDDDLDAEKVYMIDTAVSMNSGLTEYAGEMGLVPGYNHRFYFTSLDVYPFATKTSLMKLYYRPRYLAI